MAIVGKAGSRGEPRRRQRARRQDGDATRTRLLETAGKVFGELGYSATSAKLACERAGLNPASVNYYFGGKEGLYEAVLTEASRRVMGQPHFALLARREGDSRTRLTMLLTHLASVFQSGRDGWPQKVLAREIVTPSPLTAPMVARVLKPVARPFLELIEEMLGRSASRQMVQKAYLYSLGPVLSLALAAPALRNLVLPKLEAQPREVPGDLVRFVLAGLDALAAPPRRGARRSPAPGRGKKRGAA